MKHLFALLAFFSSSLAFAQAGDTISSCSFRIERKSGLDHRELAYLMVSASTRYACLGELTLELEASRKKIPVEHLFRLDLVPRGKVEGTDCGVTTEIERAFRVDPAALVESRIFVATASGKPCEPVRAPVRAARCMFSAADGAESCVFHR